MTDASDPTPQAAAAPPRPMPKIRQINREDLREVVRLGWEDFRAESGFGLFFGAFYAFGGMILWLLLTRWDVPWLMLPLGLGFPLIGPFIAVGLYEVSRQRQAGEKLRWGHVLGVIAEQRKRELGWMAFVTLFIFWVWFYQARTIMVIFLQKMSFSSEEQFFNIVFSTSEGIGFLVVGTGVGAVLSLVLFASTVVAIPLLLERDRDFVTALITSWQSVLQNPQCMIVWGIIVTAAVMAGLLTFFLGLIVVLPVLGHATWHLYQRLVEPEAPEEAV